MGDRWRRDLAADGVPPERVDELVDASHAKLTGAPALVLGCLTWDGLDRYPDEARQRAEWGMALLSLGAAVENLMLAAPPPGSRRAGSRRRSSAPRRRATRSRSRGSGCPTRSCSWATRPRVLGPGSSAGPARRAPRVRLTPRAAATGGIRRGATEVLERAAQPVFERRPRLPAQVDAGAAGSSAERCSSPGRAIAYRAGSSKPASSRHRVEQLLHARLDAGADVHDEPAAAVRGADERVDDVVDVHEVAGLLAVAEDRRPARLEQLPAKIATTPASPCGSWRGP